MHGSENFTSATDLSMIDPKNFTTSSELRQFSLTVFCYFYAVCYVMCALLLNCWFWKHMRFRWKQKLSLIPIVLLEIFCRPYFKNIQNVTASFGDFHVNYFIPYAVITTVAGIAAACIILQMLLTICERTDKIPFCAVVGGYYIGNYAGYAVLNLTLILFDLTNLFWFIGEYAIIPLIQQMLDISHTTSAAPIRRFSLNLFSYFYWFIYCVGWMIVIKKKWSIVRFGWKQLLSLLAVIYLDSYIRPQFKSLTHFAQPLGLFYPKFFLVYTGVALVVAFITAYHIGNRVEHNCEKREQLHICAVAGAYYIGYYVSYSLLNILLISIDCSNLLGTVSDYVATYQLTIPF